MKKLLTVGGLFFVFFTWAMEVDRQPMTIGVDQCCVDIANMLIHPVSLTRGDFLDLEVALNRYVWLIYARECRVNTLELEHEVSGLLNYLYKKGKDSEHSGLRQCRDVFIRWREDVKLLVRNRIFQRASMVRIPSFISLNGAEIIPSFDFDISPRVADQLGQKYGYDIFESEEDSDFFSSCSRCLRGVSRRLRNIPHANDSEDSCNC